MMEVREMTGALKNLDCKGNEGPDCEGLFILLSNVEAIFCRLCRSSLVHDQIFGCPSVEGDDADLKQSLTFSVSVFPHTQER